MKQAQVNSLNEIDFNFPYQGSQRGELTFRHHPRYGKDVILSIDRGQFLCHFDGCTVTVRFDRGKSQTYSAVEPADHSTTELFIRSYDRFVASTQNAERVYVEAQFYQQGTRVFEFDVSDFNWQAAGGRPNRVQTPPHPADPSEARPRRVHPPPRPADPADLFESVDRSRQRTSAPTISADQANPFE